MASPRWARAERVRAKITRGTPAEEILTWFDAIPKEVDRLNRVLTQYLSHPGGWDTKFGSGAYNPTLKWSTCNG